MYIANVSTPRHGLSVSASILPIRARLYLAQWTLKQLQGDKARAAAD